MNRYQKQKENIRNKAIEYQYNCIFGSYAELMEMQNYFLTAAKRFGLLREFRENGII